MKTNIRPRRSVLYMPGANDRALEKAKALAADAVILDLEDSVAPEAKVQARERVCAAVREGGYGRRELVIRTNALETVWGTTDLLAAAEAAPDAILIPKVAHPGDIISAAKILKSVNAPERTRIWAMMETPQAILYAREIAAVAMDPENRLECFVLGTNDLLKESRARALDNRFAIVPWLALTIVAARAFGLDGKTLIHPSQVGPCNEVFTPTDDEVEWSRKIIDAFSQPVNAQKGVITVEGKMVERLHLVMARRTAAIAHAVREIDDWF